MRDIGIDGFQGEQVVICLRRVVGQPLVWTEEQRGEFGAEMLQPAAEFRVAPVVCRL